jgi:hypothetical protein
LSVTIHTEAARRELLNGLIAIDEAARIALGFAVKAAERSVLGTTLYQNASGKTRGSVKTGVEGLSGFVQSGGATAFLENGTRPHEIVARRAKALHFRINGADVFARKVNHPGTAPRPFMRVAWAVGQETADLQAEHFVSLAIRRHFG